MADTTEQESGQGKGKLILIALGVIAAAVAVYFFFRGDDEMKRKMQAVRDAKAAKSALKDFADVSEN